MFKKSVAKELKSLRKQYSEMRQKQKNMQLVAESSGITSLPKDNPKVNSEGAEESESRVINHLFVSKGRKWNRLYGVGKSSTSIDVYEEETATDPDKKVRVRHISLDDQDTEVGSETPGSKSMTDFNDSVTSPNETKFSGYEFKGISTEMESASASSVFGSADTVSSFYSDESPQKGISNFNHKSRFAATLGPSSFNPFPTRGALEEKRLKNSVKGGHGHSSDLPSNALNNSAASNRSKKIAEINGIRAMIRMNKYPSAKSLSNEP